jgi:predicted phage baseplate assembly protein
VSALAPDSSLRGLGSCGCGTGLGAATPVAIDNRPGLTAVAYRAGTHGRFLASLLAGLSSAGRPALAGLSARDDDFSIALLDAWATVADVLTFYQERIANEAYLGTATELRSLLELAYALGYAPAPGLAATSYLAFTLESAVGTPEQVTITSGTRVQSLPGPGEKPQTFETIADLQARGVWNALPARQTTLHPPTFGDLDMWLQGTATGLRPGDALLIVGDERLNDPGNERWDFRRLDTVTTDAASNTTHVTWKKPLGEGHVKPAEAHPRIYALRQRAALFGSNAPDWRAMPESLQDAFKTNANDTPTNWPRFSISEINATAGAPHPEKTVYLDTTYAAIAVDGWVVLSRPGWDEVYRVENAVEAAVADFTLAGKVTKLELAGENLIGRFDNSIRATVVFAVPDELARAERPITDPVQGDRIVLTGRADGLEPGRRLIVTGKPTRLRVPKGGLTLTDATGDTTTAREDESLQVLAAPVDLGGGQQRWSLRDAAGFEGTVVLATGAIGATSYLPAEKADVLASELVELLELADADKDHTGLRLTAPLAGVYDRASTVVRANVAYATQGETVKEVLGSGDATVPYARFALRQTPLTYVPADNPDGRASTLAVRVQDVLWHEVPTLYHGGAKDRVFVTTRDDAGTTSITFGDGVEGARLPTGSENVKAIYRKGIGEAGNVRAGQLSLLMDRALGVRSVDNPLAASGGVDADGAEATRGAAPLTVLTLGRVVSLDDYRDFARGFAGIAKAQAVWTWNGHSRGIFLTVAGPHGDEVPAGGSVQEKLVAALGDSGDPTIPVVVRSYRPVRFRVSATLVLDPDYVPADVLAAARAALEATFSFERRDFGQPVALSQVEAAIQAVAGVVAVDVNALWVDPGARSPHTLLPAEAPAAGDDATTAEAAQLLTYVYVAGDLVAGAGA